jgi:RimJ/RimL family protein N-acetyltransferase
MPLRCALFTVNHVLAKDTHNLVATSTHDDPLGYAALFPEPEQHACELLVIAWEESRNRGVGTGLVRSTVQISRDLGFDALVLSVDVTNVRTRTVYEKCGFQYCQARRPPGDIRMVRRPREAELAESLTGAM